MTGTDGEAIAPPPFEIVSRRRIHDGFVTLDLYEIRQTRFDGSWSPLLRREVVIPRVAVAVLCYDPDTDRVVLVEQLRLPAAVAGYDAIQLEIVAGLIEPGETPEAVAVREVLEETGLQVLGRPERIAGFLTSPGHSTETVQLYCARVDAGAALAFAGEAAENEDTRIRTLDYEAFADAVQTGGITNGFTLTAGLWLMLNRTRLRAQWKIPAQ